jgi:hypothetical protein
MRSLHDIHVKGRVTNTRIEEPTLSWLRRRFLLLVLVLVEVGPVVVVVLLLVVLLLLAVVALPRDLSAVVHVAGSRGEHQVPMRARLCRPDMHVSSSPLRHPPQPQHYRQFHGAASRRAAGPSTSTYSIKQGNKRLRYQMSLVEGGVDSLTRSIGSFRTPYG